MTAIATDVTAAWSVRPSVTLMHPLQAVVRNGMPFCRDMIPQ